MSSDEEEDWMSDKFLAGAEASALSKKPQTYGELRKQAAQKSFQKHASNKIKSHKFREEEARNKGLEMNLFEKSQEDGGASSSKAINMMKKMGYTGSGALGKRSVDNGNEDIDRQGQSTKRSKTDEGNSHRTAPISISLWSGRKGLGTASTRRPPPAATSTSNQPATGTASSSIDLRFSAIDVEEYRSSSRSQYELRRDEGRLKAARKTLLELDDRAGYSFSILHLDSTDMGSFPPPLLEHLNATDTLNELPATRNSEDLRKQMAKDSLSALGDLDDDDSVGDGSATVMLPDTEDEDWVKLATEATKFLPLNSTQKLSLTLQYLRTEFFYCFWCGHQYVSQDEIDTLCPGADEDSHD